MGVAHPTAGGRPCPEPADTEEPRRIETGRHAVGDPVPWRGQPAGLSPEQRIEPVGPAIDIGDHRVERPVIPELSLLLPGRSVIGMGPPML